MATALKPIAHDDRLSIVDHLDELRKRLVVCVITLVVVFGVCFWQNGALLHALNKPYTNTAPTAHGKGRLSSAAAAQEQVRRGFIAIEQTFRSLEGAKGLTAAEKQQLARGAAQVGVAAAALPKTTPPRVPITTGVAEPFTVTLTVAAYFALLFSLPVLLYQAYAFILPAFSPRERRVALPMMLMVPFLFIAGVAFGYFLVLPPAVSFLQNFNNQDFDVLLQAKDYYRFAVLALLSSGLVFQLPVGLLAVNAVGILSAKKLREIWRYAIVAIAVIAAVMPGVDPVSTTILMVPLLLLYGLSILLLTLADRRRGKREQQLVVGPPDEDEIEET